MTNLNLLLAVEKSSVARRMVALAVTLLSIAACAGMDSRTERCRKLASAPLLYQITFRTGPPQDSPLGARAPYSRTTLSLHDNGGLDLWAFLPYNGPRRPNDVLRCQQLALEEHETWIKTLNRLTSHLGLERHQSHSIIAVTRERDSAGWVGVVNRLNPDAQAAARDLACLVVRAFGESGMQAMRETSPPLADWLALPGRCAASVSPQQTLLKP